MTEPDNDEGVLVRFACLHHPDRVLYAVRWYAGDGHGWFDTPFPDAEATGPHQHHTPRIRERGDTHWVPPVGLDVPLVATDQDGRPIMELIEQQSLGDRGPVLRRACRKRGCDYVATFGFRTLLEVLPNLATSDTPERLYVYENLDRSASM